MKSWWSRWLIRLAVVALFAMPLSLSAQVFVPFGNGGTMNTQGGGASAVDLRQLMQQNSQIQSQLQQMNAMLRDMQLTMMRTPHGGLNQPGIAGSTNPVVRRFTEATARMHAEMDKPLTGDADRDFARLMIPHHQGAIDMAKIELAQGKDPQLRALAQKIIDNQQKELDQLQAWQKSQ